MVAELEVSPRRRVIAILWFYMGWFACVFLARTDYAWLSLPMGLAQFAQLPLPLLLRRKFLAALALLFALGIGFDSAVSYFGGVEFSVDPTFGLIPVWLVSMWILFVAMLPLTFGFLGRRPVLSAVLGFVFGPLSYKSGEAFGVMTVSSNIVLATYAVFWAVFFPASLYFIERSSNEDSE